VVAAAVARARGFVALNLAPFGPIPDTCLERADLVVVNALEAEALGSRTAGVRGALVITSGAGRVCMLRGGVLSAEAEPPRVRAVDTTGSGDVFTAGLLLALLEGRSDSDALAFACAAAALAATRPGAQTACPDRAEVDAFLEGAIR
jgi:ribokinase